MPKLKTPCSFTAKRKTYEYKIEVRLTHAQTQTIEKRKWGENIAHAEIDKRWGLARRDRETNLLRSQARVLYFVLSRDRSRRPQPGLVKPGWKRCGFCFVGWLVSTGYIRLLVLLASLLFCLESSFRNKREPRWRWQKRWNERARNILQMTRKYIFMPG